MKTINLPEEDLQLKFGRVREEWPSTMAGFSGCCRGIGRVHSVVRGFVLDHNEIAEDRNSTAASKAFRAEKLCERYLSELEDIAEAAKGDISSGFEQITARANGQLARSREKGKEFWIEIRERLFHMEPRKRSEFLQARMAAKDFITHNAIAQAPAWLSGLENEEVKALTAILREAATDTKEAARSEQLRDAEKEFHGAVGAATSLIEEHRQRSQSLLSHHEQAA